jgi:hypothetical protein
MLEKFREKFSHPRTAEDDVEADEAVARTRETGGAPTDDADQAGTTGTGASEEFVGRVAGQDEGDDGESGAEARAERG